MTHKFLFFLSCLLLLNSGKLTGQVPGYLGKRLYVRADLSATPAVSYPTPNNNGVAGLYGEAKPSFALSTRFGMQAGYAISRKNALTFGVDYLKTGAVVDKIITPSPFASPGSEDYAKHYLFYNLTGITAELGYQKYNQKKGAIAPMGRYLSYLLSATFLNGNIVDKLTTGDRTTIHAPLGIDAHYIQYAVSMEWGKNTIVADRFVLNTAFKLRLALDPLAFSSSSPNMPSSTAGYTAYNKATYNYFVAERMSNHMAISVRLGIGILP